MDYSKLQNGSDIRGVACEGIAGEAVNLTGEAAYAIGAAFTQWLAGRCGKQADELRIGVGTDSRITGPAVKAAFCSGVTAQGAEIVDCGMA